MSAMFPIALAPWLISSLLLGLTLLASHSGPSLCFLLAGRLHSAWLQCAEGAAPHGMRGTTYSATALLKQSLVSWTTDLHRRQVWSFAACLRGTQRTPSFKTRRYAFKLGFFEEMLKLIMFDLRL